MEMNYRIIEQIKEQLESKLPEQPTFAIVLGTGLSSLSEQLEDKIRIPFAHFPEIPQPTSPSHDNAFYFGYFEGQPTLMMGGRFHYYEGYSMQELTLPIRVLCLFPLQCLWLSNAAGSVNTDMKEGDVVFVRDHINMMPEHPLRGYNDPRLGPRFPDMLNTYNKSWNEKCIEIAQELGIEAKQGVYFSWQGPTLETPAEYEMIHRLGGDIIGMSTVPEVIVAKHMNTPVIVSSIVSNLCYPIDTLTETSVEEVISVVNNAAPKLQRIIKEVIGRWDSFNPKN